MRDVKEASFLINVENALEVAIQKKNISYISVTTKISEVDPLTFFEAGKMYFNERIFWRDVHTRFYLIGLGKMIQLEAKENRFDDLKIQWETLKKQTYIHNPYGSEGTGLTCLGGMCFDAKKEKTALWQAFPDGSLTIPQYLLTIEGDTCYLTFNQELDSGLDINAILTDCKHMEDVLLNPNYEFPINGVIETKKEIAPNEWKESIKKATQMIESSNMDKVVLAREMRIELSRKIEVSPILKKLLTTQTNSYIFAFAYGDDCFVGATPERLVRLREKELLSTCLAGTAARGVTKVEDKEIGDDLWHDAKNRQEHDFVVQMIRSAITPYCDDIQIPETPTVYKLKQLQHLYTPVRAKLKTNAHMFDIIKEMHPTPALGGLPKEASLKFIREHEVLNRGWYGAPVGWLDYRDNGEFVVAIRSGLVRHRYISLFAGSGIVRDSKPEKEYTETLIKFSPMLSALTNKIT